MIDTLVIRFNDLNVNKDFLNWCLNKPKLICKHFTINVNDLERTNDLEKKIETAQSIYNFSKLKKYEKRTLLKKLYTYDKIERDLYTNYKLELPSSHYDIQIFISRSSNYIQIQFSVPKLIYGHNIAQFTPKFMGNLENDFLELSKKLPELIKTSIKILFKDFFKIGYPDQYGQVEVPIFWNTMTIERIDLCFNEYCKTPEEKTAKLMTMKNLGQKRQKVDYLPNTYGKNGISYSNTMVYFKCYDKGAEFAKNDYKKLEKSNEYIYPRYNLNMLQNEADLILRYEITYRPIFFNYYYRKYIYRRGCLKHHSFILLKNKLDKLIDMTENEICTKFFQKFIYIGFKKAYQWLKSLFSKFYINQLESELNSIGYCITKPECWKLDFINFNIKKNDDALALSLRTKLYKINTLFNNRRPLKIMNEKNNHLFTPEPFDDIDYIPFETKMDKDISYYMAKTFITMIKRWQVETIKDVTNINEKINELRKKGKRFGPIIQNVINHIQEGGTLWSYRQKLNLNSSEFYKLKKRFENLGVTERTCVYSHIEKTDFSYKKYSHIRNIFNFENRLFLNLQ